MELYRNYPKFCTIWCFIEVLLYAGQLFGWSSILYVLKQEGFYHDMCIVDSTHVNKSSGEEIVDETYTTIDQFGPINNRSSKYPIYKDWNNTIDTSTGREAHALSTESTESSSDQIYAISDDTKNEDADHRDTSGKFNQALALPDAPGEGCYQQDARLNLWFSIAICVSYVMCSIMGPILQKVGMRKFRLLML